MSEEEALRAQYIYDIFKKKPCEKSELVELPEINTAYICHLTIASTNKCDCVLLSKATIIPCPSLPH
jgi:hypothetical protein